MKLTKTDRAILDSYAFMIDGLSDYLGSACEISLHSLDDYSHSVLKIKNGYHSGRTAGAPLTDLALNMIKRIQEYGLSATHTYTSYNAISSAGEHLKASTIPILGENKRVIGVLCINFYLDSPLSEIMETFLGAREEPIEQEHFSNNVNDTLSQAIADAKSIVLRNNDISPVNKNKELIRILYNKGIFRMKNSVVEVANRLGISKNTVYLHLRNIEKKEN